MSDKIFKTVRFSSEYTVNANSNTSLSASDLGMDANTPTGYTKLAIVGYGTGNPNVIPAAIIHSKTSSGAIFLKSVSSNDITSTFYVDISFVKSGLFES